MENESERQPSTNELFSYFQTAVTFRHHEFNIQMLRNVIFTGTQAVLLAVYAAILENVGLCAAIVAAFGLGFTIFSQHLKLQALKNITIKHYLKVSKKQGILGKALNPYPALP